MSQVIIEAVGLLRTVVEKIDARLEQLGAERELLLDKRATLVGLIDGDAPPSSEVRHAVVAPAPAAIVPPPASPRPLPTPDEAAALRILTALDGQEPRRFQFLENASKCTPTKAKRLIRALVN